MTPADWKDILGALEVPEGPDEPAIPTTGEQKKESRSVSIFYERKGRGGKEVTILADFIGFSDEEISELAAELKRALGTGGSVRGGEILIQGDRRQSIRDRLAKLGIRVKG